MVVLTCRLFSSADHRWPRVLAIIGSADVAWFIKPNQNESRQKLRSVAVSVLLAVLCCVISYGIVLGCAVSCGGVLCCVAFACNVLCYVVFYAVLRGQQQGSNGKQTVILPRSFTGFAALQTNDSLLHSCRFLPNPKPRAFSHWRCHQDVVCAPRLPIIRDPLRKYVDLGKCIVGTTKKQPGS